MKICKKFSILLQNNFLFMMPVLFFYKKMLVIQVACSCTKKYFVVLLKNLMVTDNPSALGGRIKSNPSGVYFYNESFVKLHGFCNCTKNTFVNVYKKIFESLQKTSFANRFLNIVFVKLQIIVYIVLKHTIFSIVKLQYSVLRYTRHIY